MPRRTQTTGRTSETAKGLRFLGGTIAIGAATYLALGPVMPAMQTLTASIAAAMLSAFGAASSTGALLSFAGLSVQILPLCVGDIEIAVLTGAILSTADRPRCDRLYGVAAAAVFVMLANATRVAATMLTWAQWGLPALETVHSALFRVVLVLAIVGFYAAWYLREAASEKLGINRLLKEL